MTCPEVDRRQAGAKLNTIVGDSNEAKQKHTLPEIPEMTINMLKASQNQYQFVGGDFLPMNVTNGGRYHVHPRVKSK